MLKKSKNNFMAKAFTETSKKSYVFLAMLIISVAAGAFLASLPSLVLKRIVDGLLTSGSRGLWQYAFLYLGAVLLLGLCDLIREYGAMVFGQRMLLNIRMLMLERLRFLPISYFLEVPAGETISKFTADIDSVNTLFTSGIVSTAADLLKLAGLIIAMFILSAQLGFIALAALPIVYFLSNFFRKRIFKKQLAVRARVSDINTGIQEFYSGMKVIKSYGKEQYFAQRFEPLLENHRIAMNANSVYDAWFPCIMQTLRAVAIAFAIFVGASNNLTPLALGLSLGTLAAAADLFARLFDPIEATSMQIQTIQQALAGISRIKAYFNHEIETAEKLDESIVNNLENITVKIDDVRFAYKNGKDVLGGVSITIPAGTKAAIAGRTGSGKTTLMNLVAGLYPTKSGIITVGGLDPYQLPPTARRRLVGIVPQSIILFNGTIYENITLRDDAITRKQAEKALETVGLLNVINQLPGGINTLIGEGAYKLSFGQTQLLSLARAIVTDPPLLLLDELTSGLDAMTEKQVLRAIRNISGNRTIITISHRLSGIIDADTVHIMERGRIMESGAHQSLLLRKAGTLFINVWRIEVGKSRSNSLKI
jgi:ATP-binding cassette subfamily B protein